MKELLLEDTAIYIGSIIFYITECHLTWGIVNEISGNCCYTHDHIYGESYKDGFYSSDSHNIDDFRKTWWTDKEQMRRDLMEVIENL